MTRSLDNLTIAEIELLAQAHRRLSAEGMFNSDYSFGAFLDAVLARGEYASTKSDYVHQEGL